MSYYLDTSVIAAYYCPEPLSGRAEDFLTSHVHPGISPLTELELFSALSRKVREGGLGQSEAGRVAARFLSHLDSFLYEVIPISSLHYRLARDLVGQFSTPLRSLDAIHLAVASMEDRTIVTADKGLAESAEFFSIDFIFL
ncbi:MAG: type II toxin-antitoxin system VapC family toxin [Thermodesulfobacteriota bacterium]